MDNMPELIENMEAPSFFNASLDLDCNRNKMLNSGRFQMFSGEHEVSPISNRLTSKRSSISMLDVSSTGLDPKMREYTFPENGIVNTYLQSLAKSNDSGLARSGSFNSTRPKNKYDHVQSKVKQYIHGIKKQEAERKQSNQYISERSLTPKSYETDTESVREECKRLKAELQEKEIMILCLIEQKDDITEKYIQEQMKVEELRFKLYRIQRKFKIPSSNSPSSCKTPISSRSVSVLNSVATHSRHSQSSSTPQNKPLLTPKLTTKKSTISKLLRKPTKTIDHLNLEPCHCWESPNGTKSKLEFDKPTVTIPHLKLKRTNSSEPTTSSNAVTLTAQTSCTLQTTDPDISITWEDTMDLLKPNPSPDTTRISDDQPLTLNSPHNPITYRTDTESTSYKKLPKSFLTRHRMPKPKKSSRHYSSPTRQKYREIGRRARRTITKFLCNCQTHNTSYLDYEHLELTATISATEIKSTKRSNHLVQNMNVTEKSECDIQEITNLDCAIQCTDDIKKKSEILKKFLVKHL